MVRLLLPLLLVSQVAIASEPPAVERLDALNAILRAGDEARLRGFVETSFTETMRKAGPADPGILPFLIDQTARHRGFDVLRRIVPNPNHVTAVVRSVAQPSRVLRLNLSVEPAPLTGSRGSSCSPPSRGTPRRRSHPRSPPRRRSRRSGRKSTGSSPRGSPASSCSRAGRRRSSSARRGRPIGRTTFRTRRRPSSGSPR